MKLWQNSTTFRLMQSLLSLEHRHTEEKYLGDLLSSDGRNVKNIKSRIDRGKGIVSKIISGCFSFW